MLRMLRQILRCTIAGQPLRSSASAKGEAEWSEGTVVMLDLAGCVPVDRFRGTTPDSSDWHELVQSIVDRQGGRVRQSLGLGFCCVFDGADHPARAVDAAIALVTAMSSTGDDLKVRAGIATGRVFDGKVGPHESSLAAVLGAPKDAAVRLLNHCARTHTPILICPATAAFVSERYASRSLVVSDDHGEMTAFAPSPR